MINLPTPTEEQERIYSAIEDAKGKSIAVIAKAGSGKTTTIVACEDAFPPNSRVVAFNKDAADLLSNRLRSTVASTFHSLGFSVLRERLSSCKSNIYRVRDICKKFDFGREWRPYADFVDAYHTQGGGVIRPDYNNDEFMMEILGVHDVAIPEDLDLPAFLARVRKVLAHMDNNINECTFSEMLYRPLWLAKKHGWSLKTYSHLIVDEAQDVSPVRLALIEAMADHCIAVGDPDQAIYGFAGAINGSFERLIDKFSMDVYPLSVSWRCSNEVIREAQSIIGDSILAAPNAREGAVKRILESELILSSVSQNDAILCRCNAPLFQYALKLLRCRIPFVFKGDAPERLLRMAKTWYKDYPGVAAFRTAVLEWQDAQIEIWQKSKGVCQRIRDQADAFLFLLDDLQSTSELVRTLESICTSTYGIVLSTVHKAKGQEYDDVYLIRPDLIPAPWANSQNELVEERNIHYVAVTRAKDTFHYVMQD